MSVYVRRKTLNYLGTGLALACVILAILPLGAMLLYVLSQGGSGLILFPLGPATSRTG